MNTMFCSVFTAVVIFYIVYIYVMVCILSYISAVSLYR